MIFLSLLDQKKRKQFCIGIFALPLRISRSAGHRFEDIQLIKDTVHQVYQTNTKWREEIKHLAYKVAT